ncbi:DUF1343 domain-containing protein [Candidatus Dependentiae bacterium]|nr:DUF1343 domain-containing protein [Candidatus Dependentiae bacterium]MBU4386899.1 DUF1343 domain-containing protein [Candidatus Dependentiae bacterium]MCG2756375.1 DUF1343 domain-containing protein [Candidatus Dependentiae bacterium]
MNKKLSSFIKFLCLVYLAVYIPQIISNKDKNKEILEKNSIYISSIENLIKNKRKFIELQNKNFTVICDNEQKNDFINYAKILKNFNIKIETTLTDNNNLKNIFKNKNIDGIIVSIKNSGIRGDNCYNSIFKILELNQEYNKQIVILDQPNPIAKFIEGPGQIPLQHGLTAGELAKYFNNYSIKKPSNLTVIPMIGWQRSNNDKYDKDYLENLLNMLNKIKPINNSIDKKVTDRSILLPKNSLTDWEINYFKKICLKLGLICKNYNYMENNKEFTGIKIENMDYIKNYSYFNTLLTITTFLKNRKNVKLEYSDSFYKMLGSKDAIDFLTNNISFEDFKKESTGTMYTFLRKSKDILLYKPNPEINSVKLLKI